MTLDLLLTKEGQRLLTFGSIWKGDCFQGGRVTRTGRVVRRLIAGSAAVHQSVGQVVV